MQSTSPKNRVFVVGVGMTKFYKPGKHDKDYTDLSKQAMLRALRDSGIKFEQIEQAFAGYVYGDSTCGQRAIYTVGRTGIPVVNVNNNCATGSSAMFLAYNAIQGGIINCAMALGFEKMYAGSLQTFFPDRTSPLDQLFIVDSQIRDPNSKSPFAPRIFGNAGREHMEKYGTKPEHFAKVAEKNHRHSVNNPYSQFRDLYTLEQIQKSPMIHEPITKLQCCPTSDGAACAIICSEKFVKDNKLEDQAVELLTVQMTTDTNVSFESKSSINLIGSEMSQRAAQQAYKQTGITPKDIQVVELHDCFSANELLTYEAIGLCPEGKAGEAIDRGDFTYGGKVVVNPSGGLISKGHPLGATGIAQCTELCWQLRGMAEKRQVPNAKIALSHNLGLGGACVVTMYKKYNQGPGKIRADQTADPEVLEKLEAKEDQPKPKL